MNNAFSKAIMYIGVCAALLTSSYLIDGVGAVSFTLLAGICFVISLIFLTASKWGVHWLMATAERISKLKVWHLAVFFAFYRIGLASLQNERFWLGIASIYVGYIILAWVTGTLLGGQVLRPLCNKLNIFQPSMNIPKDI